VPTESTDLDRIAAVRQLLDELALRVAPTLDKDLPWVRSRPAWGARPLDAIEASAIEAMQGAAAGVVTG
jgi:hypothetical protein